MAASDNTRIVPERTTTRRKLLTSAAGFAVGAAVPPTTTSTAAPDAIIAMVNRWKTLNKSYHKQSEVVDKIARSIDGTLAIWTVDELTSCHLKADAPRIVSMDEIKAANKDDDPTGLGYELKGDLGKEGWSARSFRKVASDADMVNWNNICDSRIKTYVKKKSAYINERKTSGYYDAENTLDSIFCEQEMVYDAALKCRAISLEGVIAKIDMYLKRYGEDDCEILMSVSSDLKHLVERA
ncbi:MAG: hypothetical protein WCO00_09395 [Rhodospirillaceae bacterium]